MPNQAAVFEFGPFRLEPAERRLVRDRDAVPLTPKSFDLLVYLVEHADRLLKKEELLEHLWPGYVWGLSMAAVGRGDQALPAITSQQPMFAAVRALLEGRRRESIELMTKAGATLADPEAFYYAARFLAHLDATDTALQMLAKAVNGGYACLAPLEDDRWFDSLRGTPDFDRLVSSARERHDIGVRVLRDAGGGALLAMR
jgi:hypothetical protein